MKIFQTDVHVISQKFDDQKIELTKENSWSIRKDSIKFQNPIRLRVISKIKQWLF